MGCGVSADTDGSDKEDENEGQQASPLTDIAYTEDEEEQSAPALTCEDILKQIKTHHEIISGLGEKIESDGSYVLPILVAVQDFSNYYFSFRKLPGIQLHEIEAGRQQAAKLLVDLKLLDLVAEVYQAHYRMDWEDGEGETIPYLAVNLSAMVMVNFSDASDDFANALAGIPGLLPFLREILVNSVKPHLDKTLKLMEEDQLEQALTMIHNMTMRDNNIHLFRSHNFTEVLQPYLNSENQETTVLSLAGLAGIIDEKEADIINTRPETVCDLFWWLKKGLEDKHRDFNGWSCAEIALIIRRLAMNDANKKQLVELGALELLVVLGRTGNQQEQNESIQAIWALTFDEDNMKKICSDSDLGVVELLVELKSSENRGIRKGCHGALWNLRDAMKASPVEKYQKIGQEQQVLENERLRKSKNKSAFEKGHIMISYQWADQTMLMRVRDGLKASGYQMWMDIDQMGGSTLQAMAEAVENAYIVLISMSLKYKNSPNCRAEAEYAYQKQKHIIPLKLERGYIPDGWLGIIAGTKLFFEFSDQYPFDVKLNGLIKEITRSEATQGTTDWVTPKTAAVTYSKPPEPKDTTDSAPVTSVPIAARLTMTAVRQWTDNDVQNWINNHDLKSCNLGPITGPDIALLLKMQLKAPEFFYKTLQEMLKLTSLSSLSKFVWALNDLQTETER